MGLGKNSKTYTCGMREGEGGQGVLQHTHRGVHKQPQITMKSMPFQPDHAQNIEF